MTVSMPQPLTTPVTPDPKILEALRRVIDGQIGPRQPGAIYQNQDGAFEVLALVRDPERARALLGRRCSQWALIVRDVLRPDGEPFAIGSVWTNEDRMVRAADDACPICGFWRARATAGPPPRLRPARVPWWVRGEFLRTPAPVSGRQPDRRGRQALSVGAARAVPVRRQAVDAAAHTPGPDRPAPRGPGHRRTRPGPPDHPRPARSCCHGGEQGVGHGPPRHRHPPADRHRTELSCLTTCTSAT